MSPELYKVIAALERQEMVIHHESREVPNADYGVTEREPTGHHRITIGGMPLPHIAAMLRELDVLRNSMDLINEISGRQA